MEWTKGRGYVGHFPNGRRVKVLMGRARKEPGKNDNKNENFKYFTFLLFFQDGEKIDYTWLNYVTKNSDKVLKIKTATLDDAGTIVCKGVNGFGKAQVNIELIVLGNELFLPYLYKGATTFCLISFCPHFVLLNMIFSETLYLSESKHQRL